MKICGKDFKFEKYIEIIQDIPLRITMTKFRISDHELNIDKGKHKAMKREESKLAKQKLLRMKNIYIWNVIYTAITEINYQT